MHERAARSTTFENSNTTARCTWRKSAKVAECKTCDEQKKVESKAETGLIEWKNEGTTDRRGTQVPMRQTVREGAPIHQKIKLPGMGPKAPTRRKKNIRKKMRTFSASSRGSGSTGT